LRRHIAFGNDARVSITQAFDIDAVLRAGEQGAAAKLRTVSWRSALLFKPLK
jgi:hypothetical protein